MRWLPDRRRIIYTTSAGALVVVDTVTTVRTELEQPVKNAVFRFALAPDARTLYFGVERSESDVWIMERRR